MKKKIEIFGIKFLYDKKNVRILNPREIESKRLMKRVLQEFKERTNYKSRRTIKSWVKEWKAHNRLYKFGLFRKHTVDCDLEEHEKVHRLIAYAILGV